MTGGRLADAEYFAHHLERTQARPVVRIKYMREAYLATANEPVRVTIDTDLTHAVTLDHDLRRSAGNWIATPVDGTVVEIKFTERFPRWVEQFVRRFAMTQRSVPKYVMCLDHVLHSGRCSALSLAGMVLPPQRS